MYTSANLKNKGRALTNVIPLLGQLFFVVKGLGVHVATLRKVIKNASRKPTFSAISSLIKLRQHSFLDIGQNEINKNVVFVEIFHTIIKLLLTCLV